MIPPTLPPPSKAPLSATFWSRLVRYRSKLALGAACLLVSTLLGLAMPVVLRHAVDALAGAEHGAAGVLARVGRLCALLAVLAVVGAVARIGSRVYLFHAGRDLEYDLRRDVFARLVRLEPAWFRRTTTGDVMSRLTSDLANVRVMVAMGLLSLVSTLAMYVAALALMLRVDVRLALWSLLPFPLLMFAIRLFSRRLFIESRAVQDEMGLLSQAVQEDLAGMAVIKGYALEGARREAFAARNDRYLATNMRLATVRGHMTPLITVLGSSGALVVLFYGGHMVEAGRLSLGALLEMFSLVGMLTWPSMMLGWVLSVWQRGKASWARLEELLTAEPRIVGGGAAFAAATRGRGATLEVRDLTVTHDGRRVLDRVSVTVPAGTRCAIVGRTGGGKSSLCDALPRLVEIPPGSVFLDGTDVTTVSLADLRRRIGYAPQDAFLFSASIRDNIAFGSSHSGEDLAPLAEVQAAARAAGLERDLAGFPDGLDTIVGERGITLSGGQRQRVALARALVADPALLVLDDSLSSVDAETERDILGHLATYFTGRTSLVVSHRVAAVKDADQILVLDEGRVAERGTHAELVARGGIYAGLYREQIAESEIEALEVASA